MNTRIFKLIIPVVILFAVSSASAQVGGGYDLSWNTISGGGGTSSGGTYVLQDSIGQSYAGWMDGGEYELAGGFWFSCVCVVDLEDLMNFVADWLNPGNVDANLDGAGGVTFEDFSILSRYWLDHCPGDWPL